MGYVKWILSWERWNTDLEEYETPYSLTEFRDPSVKVAIGDNKDDFEITLTNFNGRYNRLFKPKDRITLYRVVNKPVSEVSEDDLIMVGTVRKTPHKVSYNKSQIKIKGYNYSETLAKALVFIDAQSLRVDEAIKKALNSIRAYQSSLGSENQVKWHPDNPSLRYKTDEFGSRLEYPLFGERVFYRPFRYIMEKAVTDEVTGDGRYYWYINHDNYLVWDKRQNDVKDTFDSTTDSYESLEVKKDTDDVVNFVIIKGGLDHNNDSIMTYAADYSSVGEHGFRFEMETNDVKTAQSYVDRDKNIAGDKTVEEKVTTDGMTPSWSDVNYTDYDKFIGDFRNFIKTVVLKPIGNDIIDLRSRGRIQFTVTKKPSSGTFSLGSVVACYVPEVSSDDRKPMRVESISYGSYSDSYDLVEDEGSV